MLTGPSIVANPEETENINEWVWRKRHCRSSIYGRKSNRWPTYWFWAREIGGLTEWDVQPDPKRIFPPGCCEIGDHARSNVCKFTKRQSNKTRRLDDRHQVKIATSLICAGSELDYDVHCDRKRLKIFIA